MAQQHRLSPGVRVDDVATIADSMVALHCSDPASMFLSATARMANPSVMAIESALHGDRSVVRHHGMRRTLWGYTPEVARVVHAATTVKIAEAEWKQLRKWVASSAIDEPDSWLDAMCAQTLAVVRREGPLSARQLGKLAPELTTKILAGSGKYKIEQSVHTRLLLNLGFDATIVRTRPTGTWVSSEYEWSIMAQWLGHELTGLDLTWAREDLARRYLHAFGPATTVDLQWWTGWTLTAARAALAAVGAVEVEIEAALKDTTSGWMLPDDLSAPYEDDEPWVALLPSLDPTTMGWKQRDWYMGEWETFGGPLFDTNGNAGHTVWVNGEVVGAWAQRREGSVVYELLAPVDPASRRALGEAAEHLRATIGDARVTPRFPTPLQKSLAAG